MLWPEGEISYIEVKGRSGRQAVELTENEWAQETSHRDRYWWYVVHDCDTVPQIYHAPGPFGQLLYQQTGAVRIKTSEIVKASEGAE